MATTTTPEKVKQRIEHLFQAAKDSQLVYTTAAEKAKSPELTNFFNACAQQRQQYLGQLQQASPIPLAEPPQADGSMGARAKRTWMAVREAINVEDDKVMLAEIGKAEKSTINEYEQALTEGLPEPIETAVRGQLAQMRHNLQAVEARYEQK